MEALSFEALFHFPHLSNYYVQITLTLSVEEVTEENTSFLIFSVFHSMNFFIFLSNQKPEYEELKSFL